jgi:glycine dehydrogenase subunit 2
MLSEITGMDEFSLAPAAGAQAELAGVLMMRAYHRDRGEFDTRDEILIPDSAHGTNPASAAMVGLKVVKIPSSVDGVVELDAVKASISSRTAGMMFTVPNTHGLFEPHVKEIADAVHEKGGLMYYDGANMNALLGRVKPGNLGFDIVHLNLHKTFSTPHGGGGPGAGPVGAKLPLASYLPLPIVTKESNAYGYAKNRPKSIGRLRGFHGNTAVLLRAYIYLRALGRHGLRMVSGQAVLAANYLLSLLDKQAFSPSHPASSARMHEFVCSAKPLRNATGVTASDIAKALLDHGHHAPTVYFPLTVEEALMVEPTETASIEQIEDFAASLNSIAKAAHDKPSQLNEAPRNTAVGRLDEVKASHPTSMILTWKNMRGAGNLE